MGFAAPLAVPLIVGVAMTAVNVCRGVEVVNQFNREVFWDLQWEKVSGVNIYGGAVGVIARQSSSSDD